MNNTNARHGGANDTIEQDHATGFHDEPHPECPLCQPCLPGAAHVREQEIATPTFDLPFALTAQVSTRRTKQGGLFQ